MIQRLIIVRVNTNTDIHKTLTMSPNHKPQIPITFSIPQLKTTWSKSNTKKPKHIGGIPLDRPV